MSESVKNKSSNAAEFSVSEISLALKRTVEDAFGHVRVRGEISGYRGPHSSGHAYFSLKDQKARIEAVVWRGVFNKLKFKPEEGLEVIATGKLTTFPGSSKYQISIEALEPAGAGALMALLEERKRKLTAEGLFEASRKQLLPYMPRTIGVITSPTGAVIRDIIHRISDRFGLHILVWPVRVQGETTGQEVSTAINGFNAMDPNGPVARPDLLIVARGGGSLEDLWGFNDEVVVRAASASTIPLISAVGHETDWTLLDLVADKRAPTPTGAAEIAVPVKIELEANLATLHARLHGAMGRFIDRKRQESYALARALPQVDQILALPRRRFDEAASRLNRALVQCTERKRARFERVSARVSPSILENRIAVARRDITRLAKNLPRPLTRIILDKRKRLEQNARLMVTLSFHSTLKRGFAIVRDNKGAPVTAVAGLSAGNGVNVQLRDGRFDALVTSKPEGTSRTAPPAPSPAPIKIKTAKSKKPRSSNDDQGSLF